MQYDFGNFLLQFRKENNITQVELALLLNRSRNTVRNWETNMRKPSLREQIEIIEFLEKYKN